jgi:prevent-host-death family protein
MAVMNNVGLSDAKTHLSALLERVAQGDEITIAKHGVPAAALVPAANGCKKDPKRGAERICALRRGARLEGVTIRQLLEGGRRY